jgi:tRNA(fMet)-specific endonuclease VapC
MSLWVLDTDTLTLFQYGHPIVCQHCALHPPTQVAIAVISVEEQFLGWYTRVRRAKARDEIAKGYEGLTRFAAFISRVQIFSFTEPAILRYEQLQGLKLNVGKKDLRIASITLELGATLVTRNVQDFQRIPGLALEDWTR